MTHYAHYELDLLLNRGGMGEVWLARDAQSESGEVALKRPSTDADAPREELMRRFAREARILERLAHAAIPRHIESQPAGDEPFIAMQYIRGVSIQEIIRRNTLQSIEPEFDFVVRMAWQLANVLAYLHADANLIHRDIKPDNILIDSAGNLFVIDFGIALAPNETRLTRIGNNPGSPVFLAPEQVTGKISPAVDVYAFGLLVYELLTGQLPKPGKYQPVRKIRRDVPREWDKLLGRCLEPDPLKRIANGTVLRAVIEETAAWQNSPGTPISKSALEINSFKPADSDEQPDELLIDSEGLETEPLPLDWRNSLDLANSPKVAFSMLLVFVAMLAALGWMIHSGPSESKIASLNTRSDSVTSTTQPARFEDVVTLIAQNDLRSADRKLAELVRANPEREGLRINLALLYNQQGRISQARAVLRDGIARTSDSVRLQQTLALLSR